MRKLLSLFAFTAILLLSWIPDLSAQNGTCAPPRTSISSVTQNSAAVFAANPLARQHQVMYSADMGQTWTTTPVFNGFSTNLTGLTPSTYYLIRARAICRPGDTSAYTAIDTTLNIGAFKTLGSTTTRCLPPSKIGADATSETSINVYWASVQNARGYVVDYSSDEGLTWTFNPVVSDINDVISGLSPGTKYFVRVRAICSPFDVGGTSEPSNFAEVWTWKGEPTGCTAPDESQLKVTNVRANSATINWGMPNNQNVIAYKLVLHDGQGNVLRTDTTFNIWSQTYDYFNLEPGKIYIVHIYGLCGNPNGELTSSPEPSGIDFKTTTPSNTCPFPRELRITNILGQSAFASWNPVQGALGYVFEYSADDGQTWISTETPFTEFQLWGLIPNKVYKTRVKTLCEKNTESVYSPVIEFKTIETDCLAPFDMFVTKVGDNKISVTLAQPFDQEKPVKWWLNQINMVVAEGTAESSSNIIITLPDPNAVYTLCMQNICQSPNGGTFLSETICRTVSLAPGCPTPINLSYSFENGIAGPFANITWDIPLPNDVMYYNLVIRFNNRIITRESETNNFQFFGLIEGGDYYVCVYSVCGNDSTDGITYSDSVCTHFRYQSTSQCPSVNITRVNNITETSAMIYWEQVPIAEYYIIEYSVDGRNWISEDAFDGSPYMLMFLEPGTKYFYRITTVCKNGVLAEPGRVGQFETIKQVNECPQVTALRVSMVTETTARVDWRYPINSPIVGFVLALYQNINGEWEPIDQYFTNQPPYVFENLTPGTNYGFVFASVCFTSKGDTLISDTLVRFFTTLKPIFDCPKPQNVQVSNITTTSARVFWAPAVQPGITYIIRYWKDGDENNVTTVESPVSQVLLSSLTPNTKYHVEVLALCPSEGKPITSPPVKIDFTTREQILECPTPREVHADSITQTTALVTWVGNQLATSYEVWVRFGGEWTLVGTTNNTNYLITNLVANTTYRIRIRAKCSNNTMSDFSNPIEIVTKDNDCPVPTNIQVTNITYNSGKVSWNAVQGALSYVITYYKEGDPNSVTTFEETNTFANLAPLASSTKYIVQIRTRCANGKLSNPVTTNFTTTNKPVCNVPTSLQASDITTNSATISWGSVPNAQSYEVRYRKIGDANYTTFNNASTSRLLTNLESNTNYEFCVKTICASDNSSEYSNCTPFKTLQVCNTPTNLRTTQVNVFDAVVAWDAVSGAVSYEVKLIYGGQTITQNAVTNQYTISGLSPNLTVIVQVRAICGPNNGSPFSAPLTFTTNGLPCNTPTGLVVINVTINSAIINWNSAPNAVAYELNITGPNNFNTTQTFTSPPATVNNLTPGIRYEVRVRSICADEATSAFSTFVSFNTLNFVCPSVQNLQINNITPTSGVVSWNSAGQGYTYSVGYSTDNGVTFTTLPPTNQLTATINSLPSNTTVLVRVRTICGSNGESGFTTGTFNTLDAGVCSTPTNLQVTNITTNQALVTWDIVAGAISYQVAYKDINAGFFTTINVTQNSRIITNLTPGTDYVVRVRARCSSGDNPFTEWTDLKVFTTASESNVCGTPQIIDVVPGPNFADVSWTSVAGNNGYRVAYSTNGGLSFINLPWTNNTSLRISNLSPGKEYLVRVRARCTNGTQSPFSPAFLFTTLSSREEASFANNLSMSVYPNPTRGNTNITFTSYSTESVTIRLIDLNGREVHRQNLQPLEGRNDINVDFIGLSSGMYHLQLIQEGKTFSSKLMIE